MPAAFGTHVIIWRLSELRRCGCPRVMAGLLAESDADLEQMRRLLAQGCPPRLLKRIML